MVNDEVNNKAINIEIKVAQYSAKAILKAMKKIIEDANEKSQQLADYISEKRKTNSRKLKDMVKNCLLYTSPSPRDRQKSRMPSSAWKKKKKK